MAAIIGETILKYWLTFVLGLIATGLTIFCKRYYKLWQAEKNHQKTTEQKAFYQGLEELINKNGNLAQEEDKKLQSQIDILKVGILSLWTRAFCNDCRTLLDDEHELEIPEYEALQEEYDAYKQLGGNHNGDNLFRLVQRKAENKFSNE